MNKKANVFLNIALGLFIFITGVLILPFITDDITTTRTALGCGDFSAITDGTMLTCITVSGVAPYLIWFFVSIALGFFIGGMK